MTNAALTQGKGNLPKLDLKAPDGASAEIYLYGGHVTSWKSSDGIERLFLSQNAEFTSGIAIRGGVPVIFPQFAAFGRLIKHGFARTHSWEYIGTEAAPDGRATARLVLRDSDATRGFWNYSFELGLVVTVGGDQLILDLSVQNTNNAEFGFTTALHTYLRVHDIEQVRVEGLGGILYRDSVAGGTGVQGEPALRIEGEIDRIYVNSPSSIIVREPEQVFSVNATGFTDEVIWNPGAEKGAALSDMEPDGYRRMLCVEAAVIGTPIHLLSGERWQGQQIITVEK